MVYIILTGYLGVYLRPPNLERPIFLLRKSPFSFPAICPYSSPGFCLSSDTYPSSSLCPCHFFRPYLVLPFDLPCPRPCSYPDPYLLHPPISLPQYSTLIFTTVPSPPPPQPLRVPLLIGQCLATLPLSLYPNEQY